MSVATAYVTSVKFGLNGDANIRAKSVFQVKNAEVIKGNSPAPDGIYDLRMGSTENSLVCATCYKEGGKCLGHNGHMELSKPVFQPITKEAIMPWLRIICHNCHKTHSCNGTFADCIKKYKQSLTKKVREVTVCMYCGTQQPKYSVDPKLKLIYNAEYYNAQGKEISKKALHADDIKTIFDGISDDTMAQLGVTDVSHPRNFFISTLSVVANTIRSQNTKPINGSKVNSDELTKIIKHTFETSLRASSKEAAATAPKMRGSSKINNAADNDFHNDLNYSVHQYIRGPVPGGDKVPIIQNADNEPLRGGLVKSKGKKGYIRGNIMGKRAFGMTRNTIGNNPRLPIPALSFPMQFAQTIGIREAYRSYNHKRLLGYIANAKLDIFPKATKIIKARTGKAFPIASLETGHVTLEVGDYIEHNLCDGTYVNFNRQPTLELCSISSHYIRVNKKSKGGVLGMNVIACDFYNADFDGDEMNTQHSSYLSTSFELRAISAFPNFIISNVNGSPQIGQINDSIVGLYELTKSDVRLTRNEAMLLFRNTSFLPVFDKEEYTGRDIITLSLQRTPVNYEGKPTAYDPFTDAFFHYADDEKKTVIRNGVMLSGLLDKAAIGSGGHKNLYHIIEMDYGAQAAIDVMFDHQQISIDFIQMKGFALGTKDVILPEEARAEIRREEAKLMEESRLITDRLNRGAIIPPIGKTTKAFYEELQSNALQPADIYNEILLRNIRKKENGLLSIIMSGSKGKINNLMAIAARAGQMLINGERLRDNAGYKRTTPYSTRYDDDPRANGYITGCYTSGMTVLEYFSNASNARFDLITKALSTSVTGDKNRNAVKNFENIIVDNLFRCMRGRRVVQMIEGEDGFSPQKVQKLGVPIVFDNEEAIRKKYADQIEPEFVNAVIASRRILADSLLKCSILKVSTPVSATVRGPYDIDRIVLNKFGDVSGRASTEKNFGLVAAFAELLPRMYLNSRYKGPVHEQFKTATTNLRAYTIVTMAKYAGRLTADEVRVVLDECSDRFFRALVDPGTAIGIQTAQCVCAPMTQYMLDSHTRSASGGTAKSSMDHVQEIVNATPLAKLSNPTMYLVPKSDIIDNKAAVQLVANEIEMMNFERFIRGDPKAFFEEYGEPVHPDYAHERAEIEAFDQLTMVKRPPNLVNWCVRYELDKTNMILKGMSVTKIIQSLRDAFPDCYFMYKSDIASVSYIRQYFVQAKKKAIDSVTIREHIADTCEHVIRGVKGIKAATVTFHQYTDPVTFTNREGYAIRTTGSNIAGVITHPKLDPRQVHSSSIIETEQFFGICAARNKIVVELDVVASGGDPRHKYLYADEMTRVGRVVSIERPGLGAREPTDILSRAALSSPAKAFADAATNRICQEVSGVSDRLMTGDVPHIGTLYNKVVVDVNYIRDTVTKVSDFSDEYA